ncbi:fasciclin-like arabinogalactan protein 21 [Quillaja saponaria]|uniref:Fasciclin-like arabinogalactan protein 21 n=1 Tax=Quillaja saponaria TaxID=32244 RepID=A0AAD7LFM6_QUISA|nr:fasciclin-like arabinogalactan protein 21 [Quillaja saponaria]
MCHARETSLTNLSNRSPHSKSLRIITSSAPTRPQIQFFHSHLHFSLKIEKPHLPFPLSLSLPWKPRCHSRCSSRSRLIAFLCNPKAAAIEGLDTTFTSSTTIPSSITPLPQDLQLDHSFFSHTSLLPPILSHLGFHELATVVPSLSESTMFATSAWTGPSTLFAPSDASLRSCFSCSLPSLLREHIVPGLFTMDYLRKLAFGTKIETLSLGRCITVTSDSFNRSNSSTANPNVFIGGVEITQPDLFNNGLVVIHGLQGFIFPLSPFSCDVERMTSLSLPFHPDDSSGQYFRPPPMTVQPGIMRLMLRDAILRLRNNGFSILSLAMKVKFHIVPNQYLMMQDLESLPVGTSLPSLEQGQSLVITTAGGRAAAAPLRINYVRIKVPDMMHNFKIVVHSVYLPFPHINPVAAAYDTILGGGSSEVTTHVPEAPTVEESCAALEENGSCTEIPMPQVKPMEDIEDHHGM